MQMVLIKQEVPHNIFPTPRLGQNNDFLEL